MLPTSESGVFETDGDAVNKGLHPPFWTALGGPCVPGVAIGFEIGVGMATFSLEESGWELGGIGFSLSLIPIYNQQLKVSDLQQKPQLTKVDNESILTACIGINLHKRSPEFERNGLAHGTPLGHVAGPL